MSHYQYRGENLICEDLEIESIASEIETPFYCYSFRTLRDNINKYKKNEIIIKFNEHKQLVPSIKLKPLIRTMKKKVHIKILAKSKFIKLFINIILVSIFISLEIKISDEINKN